MARWYYRGRTTTPFDHPDRGPIVIEPRTTFEAPKSAVQHLFNKNLVKRMPDPAPKKTAPQKGSEKKGGSYTPPSSSAVASKSSSPKETPEKSEYPARGSVQGSEGSIDEPKDTSSDDGISSSVQKDVIPSFRSEEVSEPVEADGEAEEVRGSSYGSDPKESEKSSKRKRRKSR